MAHWTCSQKPALHTLNNKSGKMSYGEAVGLQGYGPVAGRLGDF